MNDIVRIIKLLEDSSVLIRGVIDSVKHEINKQESGFPRTVLTRLAVSIVQPVIYSVEKGISGRGVRRVGRGYIDKNF